MTYLPSGPQSKTKSLLDSFLSDLEPGEREAVETVDLLRAPPPNFSEVSISAYYKRNYRGQPLTPEEAELLVVHDRLTRQLKSADVVVMAYPMHNFSMPGIVKSYFDAVMLAGETFRVGMKNTGGLMAGKRALTIYTSGGLYPADKFAPEFPNWDAVSLLARIEFQFMGFSEIEIVGTSLRDPAQAPTNLEGARNRLREIVTRWYRTRRATNDR